MRKQKSTKNLAIAFPLALSKSGNVPHVSALNCVKKICGWPSYCVQYIMCKIFVRVGCARYFQIFYTVSKIDLKSIFCFPKTCNLHFRAKLFRSIYTFVNFNPPPSRYLSHYLSDRGLVVPVEFQSTLKFIQTGNLG